VNSCPASLPVRMGLKLTVFSCFRWWVVIVTLLKCWDCFLVILSALTSRDLQQRVKATSLLGQSFLKTVSQSDRELDGVKWGHLNFDKNKHFYQFSLRHNAIQINTFLGVLFSSGLTQKNQEQYNIFFPILKRRENNGPVGYQFYLLIWMERGRGEKKTWFEIQLSNNQLFRTGNTLTNRNWLFFQAER
jgi:hypothetical protein